MKTKQRRTGIFLFIVLYVIMNPLAASSQDIDMTGSQAATTYPRDVSGSQDNVDLSTGMVSPRIPIAQISGRDLAASVSFVYINGSGYKYDTPKDILDHLGKGWKLNAGGYIKRSVRGIRDDKFYGQAPFSSDHANARGWLDLITNISSSSTDQTALWVAQNQNVGQLVLNDLAYSGSCPGSVSQSSWNTGRNWYYSGVTHNCEVKEFDSEPDLFEYNLNGNTGTFIFDEDAHPMFLQESNIKIELPALNANNGGNWVLTTPDGTKYIFQNDDAYREVTTETYISGLSDSPSSTQQNEHGSTREYISTWYLTRIESVTGDQINFSYSSADDYTFFPWADSRQDYSPGFIPGANTTNPANDPNLNNGNISNSMVTRFRKNIGAIETSRGKIEFYYNAGGKALIGIKQFNKNNLLQKDFEIPDFYPAKKIIQKPVDGSKNDLVFSFEYFERPGYGTGMNKWDWWGYYNVVYNQPIESYAPFSGSINGLPYFSLTGSDRNPNFPGARTNVLKKITYPSGVSTEFEYEQNDFLSSLGSNQITGGLRIKKITVHDGVNPAGDMITEYAYHKLNSGESSGESSSDFSYLCTINAYFILHPTNVYTLGSLSRLKYFVSRSTSPTIMHSQDHIRYSHVEVRHPGKGKTAYNLTAYSDHPDSNPETREFNYGLAGNFTSYFLPSQGINGMKNDNSIERGLITKKTVYDESGNLLKEVNYDYEFHPAGYTEKVAKGLQLFSHNYFSYVTNSSGITSSPCGEHNESGNNYSAEYYSVKSRWIYLKKTRTNDYDPAAPGNFLYKEQETLYENLQHKQPTQEKILNSDGTYSRTYYKYSAEFTIPGTSLDEPSEALNTLQQKNAILPVQVIHTEEKDGSEKIVSGSVSAFKNINGIPCLRKKYNMETNGDVDFAASYFVDVNSSGNFIMDPIFKNYSQFSNYSQYGQPLETIHEDGTVTSAIYDENFNNSIASVGNASVSGGECDFFGFDGTQTIFSMFSSVVSDHHTGIGSNKVDPNPDQANGQDSYSYGKDFFPANHNRKYKVSAWVKTENDFGNIPGKAGALVICAESAPFVLYTTAHSYQWTPLHDTQGKWEYFETILDLPKVKTEIPLQIADPIGFSAYAVNSDDNHYFLIDDIRVQPAEASVMNTIAFEDQFGNASSKSDARNSPVYYGYDHYGRSAFVRDEKGNILKKNEYNSSLTILEDPVITIFPSSTLINTPIDVNGFGYSNKSEVTYLFNFNDGSTSTSPTNTHPFSTPGDHTISLTVTDAAGNSKTTSKIVHISTNPISAQIIGPTSMSVDHNLHPHVYPVGDYHLTLSGGLAPFTYNWTIENSSGGTVASGTDPIISYEFTVGTYHVYCTIHDSFGNTASDDLSVEVHAVW